MFNFLSMAGNYEERKIGRYDCENGCVSTCRVTDSRDPFETGISYEAWGPDVVVVETYTSQEAALNGHAKWERLMREGGLPLEKPADAGTNVWADLCRTSEDTL